MRVEVCFLVSSDGTVLWSDRGTPGALPDSTERWRAIWRHRDELAVIAHTHPGGLLAFSPEDRTTMAAIDAALGRPLRYAVVTDHAVLYRDPDGSLHVAAMAGSLARRQTRRASRGEGDEPAWVTQLRAASAAEPDKGGGPEGLGGGENDEVADGDSQHHVPGTLG